MRNTLPAFVLALLGLLCPAASADVVVLKDGWEIPGAIVKESKDSVTLETGYGRLLVPRSDIKEIRRDRDAVEREYRRRLAEAAGKLRELAEWCERHGLLEEAKRHGALAEEWAGRAGAREESGGADTGVFEAVWKAVRDKFYDRKTYNGCDWEAARKKYLPRARAAKNRYELYDVCNEMLAELRASHCYLWSAYVWRDHVRNEFAGEKTLQAGIEILKTKGRFFVRTVYDGGPSEKAGITVGDEVVSVNGEPPGESDRVVVKDGVSTAERALFTLRTDDGKPVSLGLRRRKGGAVEIVKVRPAMTSMLEAARRSVRVVERNGWRLGYVHLWHFMNAGMARVLREALAGELKDCDGLVLDVRGRGGSPWVIRRVLDVFTNGAWRKPAVLVVDEDTSSAKEIFAFHWKRRKIGPVVGRRTAGHVLGSGGVPMPDGSMLLIARVRATTMTCGVDLEGNGVEPDVVVERTFEYCGGDQPILKKAFEVLLRRVKKVGCDFFFETPVRRGRAA